MTELQQIGSLFLLVIMLWHTYCNAYREGYYKQREWINRIFELVEEELDKND